MSDPTQVHIFLDIDGVLADFDRHLREQGKIGPDGKPKWDELDYQFWATIPVSEGARAFYDDARKLGITKFLSAPTPTEGCLSGKAKWLKNFVPERGKFILLDLILCPRMDKSFLARPNHILVDDREQNIKEWEAAGGIGIHHTGDFKATLEKLKEAVAKLTPAVSAPQKKPPQFKP